MSTQAQQTRRESDQAIAAMLQQAQGQLGALDTQRQQDQEKAKRALLARQKGGGKPMADKPLKIYSIVLFNKPPDSPESPPEQSRGGLTLEAMKVVIADYLDFGDKSTDWSYIIISGQPLKPLGAPPQPTPPLA